MRLNAIVLASLCGLVGCEGTDAPGVDPAVLTDGAVARPDGAAAPDVGPGPDGASDQAPPADDGVTDGAVAMDGAPPPDQGPPPDMGAQPAWPTRSCSTSISLYRPDFPSNPGEVLIAGDFTGWGDAPLRLQPTPSNTFQITLSEADGLVPGQLHAYKLIVDGQWRIHRDAAYRKFDGDCVNSALRLPDCNAPDFEVPMLQVEGDTVSLELVPSVGADGVTLARVEVSLDGEALPMPAIDPADEIPILRYQAGDLPTGKHRFTVTITDAEGRQVGPSHLPFWVEEAAFDWRDSILYLLFLDRFANGDPAADGTIGAPVEYPADWHGGDLEGALAVLESGYFERLGVKAIWLSPINAQIDGHWADRGDGSQRYASYHGYWPISGREIDARYGGNDGLRAFIEAAHARGIRVLLDLINNQVHEEHEYFLSNPEWFRTACVCGIDPGCGWSERPLDCLFAEYLPDINWRNAGAEAQFIADALYWIEEFDVDGFRVDAVKHVETTSVYNLRAAIAERFERAGHRVVMLGETAVGEGDRYDDNCGEIYGDGYAWISAYTGRTGLDGQFDFPTHHRLQYGVLTGTMGYDEVETSVRRYEERYGPDALHVQFLGSHDSNRMATRAAFDPAQNCRWQSAGECVQLPRASDEPAVYTRLRRAFTLLFTLPGMPLLYYGDEIGLAGGNDPDSRRDMWWSGELQAVELADGGDPSAEQEGLRAWIEAIAAARADWPSLTRGQRSPLLATADLYVYARHLDGEVTLVVLNRGGAVDGRAVPLGALGGGDFVALAGDATATADGNGVRLSIGAGESAILGRR